MSNVPTNFADRVKEKINATVADLLPPEDISRLVDSQLQHFMSNDLQPLVKKLIAEHAAELVKQGLRHPDLQPQWDGMAGTTEPSKVIKAVMTEHGAAIFASMFGSMVQSVVYQLQNNSLRPPY